MALGASLEEVPYALGVSFHVRNSQRFRPSCPHLKNPVALACRNFGISRKTAYKWLKRYRNAPDVPLLDLSRRPRSSPLRTAPDIENLVLSVRTKFGWGPRKIHAHLVQQQHPLPSV